MNNINHQTCSTTDGACYSFKKCFSLRAVLIGALVGVGLSFLLNLFSVAIGLTVFTTTPEGVTALAIGGYIGYAIGIIVAMFVSGFVAGFLGKSHYGPHNLGGLYGFSSWCVGLLLLVLLAAPVAKYVSASANALTNNSIMVVKVNENTLTAPVSVNKVHETAIDKEKVTNDMGKVTFALFSLFFLGAFFSTLGGYCAGSCCKKCGCCKKCECSSVSNKVPPSV